MSIKGEDALVLATESIKELNSNLEKWNMPSKNILITSGGTYSDVTHIDTTDASADINKPCKVHQTSSGSALVGMPSVFPQGVGFVGIRYVEYFNPQNICVRLEEITPVMGRVWYRKYNGNSWGNWDNLVPNSNFEMKTATLNKNYIAMNICSVCGVKYIRCSTYPNGNMTSGREYPVGTLAAAFWPTHKVSQKVDTGSGEGWLFINNLTGEVSFSPLVDMTTSTSININFAYI